MTKEVKEYVDGLDDPDEFCALMKYVFKTFKSQWELPEEATAEVLSTLKEVVGKQALEKALKDQLY
jgi:hypothetical protein